MESKMGGKGGKRRVNMGKEKKAGREGKRKSECWDGKGARKVGGMDREREEGKEGMGRVGGGGMADQMFQLNPYRRCSGRVGAIYLFYI
jgi:hypothetical protein